jgi:formylglycine-generating enzyme required for sulfatase activity
MFWTRTRIRKPNDFKAVAMALVLLWASCLGDPKSEHKNTEIPALSAQSLTAAPEGMRWIPGGLFRQGARDRDKLAMPHERPAHWVRQDGFFMDITEVTNAQFRTFAEQTGYVTTAERPVDWEELKKQLLPGTPKPADSLLQPGSMVFKREVQQVANLRDISQWWHWKLGANWRHPQGPGSNIEGKDSYPSVHISYEDALAYCAWAGHRLPTEAEWELAAQGEDPEAIFSWGDDLSLLTKQANTWDGVFPTRNEGIDGFAFAAPVGSFSENARGLYDMAGNVWEWTQDWYNTTYYSSLAGKESIYNPQGAEAPYNSQNPLQAEKVIKGGSYLCHASYCASYRIAARMGMSPDSSTDHVGFRTVVTEAMLKKKDE